MNYSISKEFKIAMDKERAKEVELKDVIGFYFNNDIKTEKFITKCLEQKKTRLMLNRLQWFVELSDHQNYDNVKVFFLIAMAETNIKLRDNRFEESDKQMEDATTFFNTFSTENKNILTDNFFTLGECLNKKPFYFEDIVDILINVRHAVVHGKNHYSFKFHNGNESFVNLVSGVVGGKNNKKDIKYNLTLTYDCFKKIMVSEAIKNIEKCF